MGATASSPMRGTQLQQRTSQRKSTIESMRSKKRLKDSSDNMLHQRDSSTPSKSGPKSLLDVPNEILAQILDHVHDNAAIHHMQLVNKRLYPFATQRLYRHFNMTLVEDSSKSDTHVQYLTKHIDGHAFIRDLEVSLSIEFEDDPTDAYQRLVQLLEHLPQDKLFHFRSNFNRPLPPSLLKKLWSSQKRLRNLEILPNPSVDDYYPTNAEDTDVSIPDLLQRTEFTDLESIRIVPDCSETASLCNMVLRKCQEQAGAPATGWLSNILPSAKVQKEKVKRIIALEVDGCQWREAEEQGMTAEDQLVESLFADIPRARPSQKGALDHFTALMLKDVDLSNSRLTWLTYLNLGNLKRLGVHYCPGVDRFLLALASDRADTPVLASLSIIHDLGHRQNDRTIEAIDILLRCPCGQIEDLELCLHNADHLPQIGSIAQHGDSLRTLFLDITTSHNAWRDDQNFLVYDSEVLAELLSPCTRLRELALGLTEYGFDYLCYKDFSLKIEQCLRAIFKSTMLDVLSILNGPDNHERDTDRLYNDDALGFVAMNIYQIHRNYDSGDHPLRIVAFGNRICGTELDHRFYVPTTAQVLGETTYTCARVTLPRLRKAGLAGKLLDYPSRDFDERHRKRFNPTETGI